MSKGQSIPVLMTCYRGVYTSDETNEFLKQRLIDLEKDRSTIAPNKGPIKIYENVDASNSSTLDQNTETILEITVPKGYCSPFSKDK